MSDVPVLGKIGFIKQYKLEDPEASRQEVQEAWQEERHGKEKELERQEKDRERQFELERLRLNKGGGDEANSATSRGAWLPKPEKWVDWALTFRGAATVGASLLGVGALARMAIIHRANRKFSHSLIQSAQRQQRDASPFVSRGSPFPRVPAGRATIFQGRHRDGKSITLSHAILTQWYPWYSRLLWPARGFYLEGSQTCETAQIWLSGQLATGSESPLTHIQDLVEMRAAQQRMRTLLLMMMPWLPSFCHPQPSVIIIDQAEELIRAHRAEFLVLVKELVRLNRNCPSTLQVIFVVNTDEAVQSLQNLNGGDLFEPVVHCPTPTTTQVEATLGAEVSGLFDKFNRRLGVAISYARSDKTTTPEDFLEAYRESYKKDVVCTVVTKDEIGEVTDRFKHKQNKGAMGSA